MPLVHCPGLFCCPLLRPTQDLEYQRLQRLLSQSHETAAANDVARRAASAESASASARASLQQALEASEAMGCGEQAVEEEAAGGSLGGSGSRGAETSQGGCQAAAGKEKQQGPASSGLWVRKYAPHSFLSLLSDEQTNRCSGTHV